MAKNLTRTKNLERCQPPLDFCGIPPSQEECRTSLIIRFRRWDLLSTLKTLQTLFKMCLFYNQIFSSNDLVFRKQWKHSSWWFMILVKTSDNICAYNTMSFYTNSKWTERWWRPSANMNFSSERSSNKLTRNINLSRAGEGDSQTRSWQMPTATDSSEPGQAENQNECDKCCCKLSPGHS